MENLDQDAIFNFAPDFTDREWKTLINAVNYADDPFGDVAHNLKIIVAKLVIIINALAVLSE